jgi:hypothetical protein
MAYETVYFIVRQDFRESNGCETSVPILKGECFAGWDNDGQISV